MPCDQFRDLPMTGHLSLEPRLDLAAARPLVERLADAAGSDLTVDAGGVEHLGGLALQALLAARQQWTADGRALVVAPRSAAFDAALSSFGIDATIFDEVPG